MWMNGSYVMMINLYLNIKKYWHSCQPNYIFLPHMFLSSRVIFSFNSSDWLHVNVMLKMDQNLKLWMLFEKFFHLTVKLTAQGEFSKRIPLNDKLQRQPHVQPALNLLNGKKMLDSSTQRSLIFLPLTFRVKSKLDKSGCYWSN